jgi:hypothetical protein
MNKPWKNRDQMKILPDHLQAVSKINKLTPKDELHPQQFDHEPIL